MSMIKKLHTKFDNNIEDMYKMMQESNILGQAAVIAGIMLYFKHKMNESTLSEKRLIKQMVVDISNTFLDNKELAIKVNAIIKEMYENVDAEESEDEDDEEEKKIDNIVDGTGSGLN